MKKSVFKDLWRDFPGQRLLVRMLVVNDLLVITMPAIQTSNEVLSGFIALRVLLYTTAEIIYFVRRSRRSYLAFISDLSDEMYWNYVFTILFTVKLLFLKYFISLSSLEKFLDVLFVVLIITLLLRSLQSQEAITEEAKKRDQRIAIFRRKSKLSDEEFDVMIPEFYRQAMVGQREPRILRFTVYFVSVILGAFLSSYAGDIADWIEKNWRHLPHLLPPG